MDREDMVSKLHRYTQEKYEHTCDIKKYLLFVTISSAFSLYYILVEPYESFGLMLVFTMITGALIFYIIQLLEKRAIVLDKLNYICNKLYGKNYNMSKIEADEDIIAFLTKK